MISSPFVSLEGISNTHVERLIHIQKRYRVAMIPERLLIGRVAEDNCPVRSRRGHVLARLLKCIGFAGVVRAQAGKSRTSMCTVLDRGATDQCSLKDRRGFGRNGEAGEDFAASITGGEMVHLRPFLLRQSRYSE